MNLRPLTSKEAACLTFIGDFLRANGGVSPTMREIAAALALSSVSRVRPLLDALEVRGLIRRFPDRARSIEVASAPRPWADGLTAASLAGLFPTVAADAARRTGDRA